MFTLGTREPCSAEAEKLWQSIKSGKRGNKSSSESFNAYSTSSSESESDSSSSDVDGGNTRGGSTPARRKGGKSTKKNKKNKKRSVSTATTNAAPNYATLLGALSGPPRDAKLQKLQKRARLTFTCVHRECLRSPFTPV